MSRIVTIGAAQLGPIPRTQTRADAVERLIALLRQAHAMGCELIVYPEVALTAFFPHWYIGEEDEIDAWCESEMPSAVTRPLFDEAARLKVGFCLGFAELAVEGNHRRRYNSAVLVERDGRIVGKYRKVHLPGHTEHEPWRPFQNLEKRYFAIGNLGFPVWRAFGGIVGMCICNDRRWPETYRVMGLQGVELVLLGYNTPAYIPDAPEQEHLGYFHNQLSMQAGAYQNGTWVVGVAKAGTEEGVTQIAQSQIIAPSGETVAMSATAGDELIVARCDLDLCNTYKQTIFNFAAHRVPDAYRMIVERKGAVLPE